MSFFGLPLVIQVFRIRTLTRQNHFHSLANCIKRCSYLLKPRDALFESVQVEGVPDVIIVYFNKELVPLEITKP